MYKAITLLFLFALTSLAALADNADDLDQRAVAERKNGNNQAAVKSMTAAISIQPKGYRYGFRASARADLGDVQGALDDYAEAIRLEPSTECFYNRGKIWLQQKKYAKAVDDNTNAIKYWTSSSALPLDLPYDHRGWAKCRLGDYAGAIRDFQEALRIAPNDALTWYHQAYTKHEAKDYKGALSDYTKSITLSPKIGDAFLNRANLKRTQFRDYAGCVADCNEVLRLDANDLAQCTAFFYRAAARKELGQYRESAEDATQAIKLGSYANLDAAFVVRGQCREALKDMKGALQDLDEAVKLNPSNYRNVRIRGRMKLEAGDIAGAEWDLRHALKLNGNDFYGYIYLSDALRKQRKFNDAYDWLKLLKGTPDKGDEHLLTDRLKELEALRSSTSR